MHIGDLPRPGLKPVSAALAGRFLTTAPPGKSTPVPFLTQVSHQGPRTTSSSPQVILAPSIEVHRFIWVLFSFFLPSQIAGQQASPFPTSWNAPLPLERGFISVSSIMFQNPNAVCWYHLQLSGLSLSTCKIESYYLTLQPPLPKLCFLIRYKLDD